MAEAKKTKKRRSEKEKVQEQYDLVGRKLVRVQERKAKVRALLEKITAEETELQASADFWASHPLLRD